MPNQKEQKRNTQKANEIKNLNQQNATEKAESTRETCFISIFKKTHEHTHSQGGEQWHNAKSQIQQKPLTFDLLILVSSKIHLILFYFSRSPLLSLTSPYISPPLNASPSPSPSPHLFRSFHSVVFFYFFFFAEFYFIRWCRRLSQCRCHGIMYRVIMYYQSHARNSNRVFDQ